LKEERRFRRTRTKSSISLNVSTEIAGLNRQKIDSGFQKEVVLNQLEVWGHLEVIKEEELEVTQIILETKSIDWIDLKTTTTTVTISSNSIILERKRRHGMMIQKATGMMTPRATDLEKAIALIVQTLDSISTSEETLKRMMS
jgi:hypothetical protein